MKTTNYTLIIAITLVHFWMLANLWSAKKAEKKQGIQVIGYKAVINDSILIDSILQDTTGFKKVFPYVQMKFIIVTKKL